MTDLHVEHRYIGVTESGDEWAPRFSPDGLKSEMEDNPVGSCWPGTDERYDALVSIRHETRFVSDWTQRHSDSTPADLDERMDQWLNDQADACGIPDDERQEFIEAMRRTMAFAVTQATTAWELWLAQSWIARLADWLSRKLFNPRTTTNGDR